MLLIMSTKPDDLGKQQEVLETLQKVGTLKKSTVVHVSPANQTNVASKVLPLLISILLYKKNYIYILFVVLILYRARAAIGSL